MFDKENFVFVHHVGLFGTNERKNTIKGHKGGKELGKARWGWWWVRKNRVINPILSCSLSLSLSTWPHRVYRMGVKVKIEDRKWQCESWESVRQRNVCVSSNLPLSKKAVTLFFKKKNGERVFHSPPHSTPPSPDSILFSLIALACFYTPPHAACPKVKWKENKNK